MILRNGAIEESYIIDHINRIRNDNRIENLRLVTHSQNQWNKENTRGYSWQENCRKWRAYIGYDKCQYTIEYYEKEENAREAYVEEKKKYHLL